VPFVVDPDSSSIESDRSKKTAAPAIRSRLGTMSALFNAKDVPPEIGTTDARGVYRSAASMSSGGWV